MVDDVSFTVDTGEVFGLLGPNGAGKTTTVEILEGYREPDGGEVQVLGLHPMSDRRALSGWIGVMLQEGGLHPGLRAGEAVRLFASFYEDPLDPGDLLERVGLASVARAFVRRLSGGERQRLALALALVGRPELLFLDEPTAGMDPRGRAATWEVITELRSAGTAVLLTTHDMREAEELSDRLAILDRGRIVAQGTPSELTASAVEEIRFRAPPDLDVVELAHALGLGPGGVTQERLGEYRVAAPASPATIAELTSWLRDQGVALGDLQATRRSLEEVFLRLTGEETTAVSEARRRGARR